MYFTGEKEILEDALQKINWDSVFESLFYYDNSWAIEFHINQENIITFAEIQKNSYQPVTNGEKYIGCASCGWDIDAEFNDYEYDGPFDDDVEKRYFDDCGEKIYRKDWIKWWIKNVDQCETIDHIIRGLLETWEREANYHARQEEATC